MTPRRFGRSRTYLSPVTFGSMRLDPTRIPKDRVVELFDYLSERGVSTFHSSYEYASFPYFCECLQAWRRLRPGASLQHIVKLPSPHFDEHEFSADAFERRVDRYLQALGTERLDVVQWLVRGRPNTTENRMSALRRGRDAVAGVWERLQRKGKVGALASFPYDPVFAEAVVDLPVCEGLVTYLGPAETEYADFIDRTGFVGIRPLFAGTITPAGIRSRCREADRDARRKAVLRVVESMEGAEKDVASFAVRYSLMHDGVTSTIVSLTSREHAEELLDAVEDLTPDRTAFRRVTASLKAAHNHVEQTGVPQ